MRETAPVYAPGTEQGASSGDVPVPKTMDAVESDVDCVSIITCAYAYGARDADVAALLTAHLKQRGSPLVIPVTQIQGRLQKYFKESDNPEKGTVQRSQLYRSALLTKIGGNNTEALDSAVKKYTDPVKQFLREHNAGAFWQYDETCRAVTIALLEQLKRYTDGTANDTQNITVAGLAHALLEAFQLKTTHRSIEAVLQRRITELGLEGYIAQLKASLPADFSDNTAAERASAALQKVHMEAYATRREDAEWMQRPEVVAAVSALLVLKPSRMASLSGRHVEDAVPLKSIGAIIHAAFGVHAWDASLRALVSRAGSQSAASEYLQKVTGITTEQIRVGTQAAEKLWESYVQAIEQKTFLQSELFRNNDACACAYVLLGDTQLPLNALKDIIHSEFPNINVSRSLFQLMRSRHVTREMVAAIIKHHKGDELSDALIATYKEKIPAFKERYLALMASARSTQADATRRKAARKRHAQALPVDGLTVPPTIPLDLSAQAMPIAEIDAFEDTFKKMLGGKEVSWARVRERAVGNQKTYEIYLERAEELVTLQERKEYLAFLHYINMYGKDVPDNRMYVMLRKMQVHSVVVWTQGEEYVRAISGKKTKVRGQLRVEITVPYESNRGRDNGRSEHTPDAHSEPVVGRPEVVAAQSMVPSTPDMVTPPDIFSDRHAQMFFERIRNFGVTGSVPGIIFTKGTKMLARMEEQKPIMHSTLVIDSSVLRDRAAVDAASPRFQELTLSQMFLTYVVRAAERMKNGEEGTLAKFLKSINIERIHITDLLSKQRGGGVISYEKKTLIAASVPGAQG